MALNGSFVWGRAGAQLTPDQVAQQRELELALLQKGVDTSPVGSWTQGLARVADAAAGSFRRGALDRKDAENRAYDADQQKGLASAFLGETAAAPDASTPAATIPLPTAATDIKAGLAADPVQGVMDASSEQPAWLKYDNTGATRSQPLNPHLTQALSFLPKLGVSMDVFSGGQPTAAEGGPRTGSNRHDHGNAADVFFSKDGRRLDWANPDDQPIFQDIVRQGKAAGITGFGAGDGYMQPGSMHIGFGNPAVWGAGGRGSNAPDWLREAYNSPSSPVVRGQQAPGQVASLDPSAGMASIPAAGVPLPGQPSPDEQIPVPTARPSVSDAVTMAMAQNGVSDSAQPDQSAGIPLPQAVPSALLSQTPLANQSGGMADAQPGLLAIPAQTSSIPSDPRATAVPPLPPPVDVANAPPVASVPAVAAPSAPQPLSQPAQRVAQALAPQVPPATLQRAMQAMSDPRTSDATRKMAGMILQQEQSRRDMVLKQQLEQASPKYQGDLAVQQATLDKMNREANDPINVGGVLVDRKTRQPVYQPGISASDQATLDLNKRKADDERSNNALTPDIKEYNFYADAARKAGHDPVSPDVFWQEMKKSGAQSTTINNGDNSGAFAKKADEEAATRIGSYISDGTAANRMLGDVQQLADLGSQIGTGKGAQVMASIGPYAQAMGIDVKGLGEAQAYQAVIDRMAPNMRPTGSGSSSDTDVKMFLNSLPSLGNVPGGNQIITQTLAAIQQQKVAAAQIAQKAIMPKEAGGITWQEAEQQIRDLGNPYETFNKYRQTLSNDGKKSLPSDNLTRIKSVDDYNGLPKGTQYVDPNGKVRTKN